METHIACMWEGGVGAPAGGSERKKEREDVHIWICSMGTFNGQKVRWGVIVDLLVKGGQGGSKETLAVS